MLLDSFGETKKTLNYSDFRSNYSFPVTKKEVYVAPSLSMKDSSKTSSGILISMMHLMTYLRKLPM